MLTAEQIRSLLKMQPLPEEGGYYAETYRSKEKIPREALPFGYPGERALATAIYYLLTPETFSAMHKLRGDEVYHFYQGDAVELLELKSDGTGELICLGSDLLSGMRHQHVVPGGAWQGSRVVAGGRYALLGTTMAPGFDFQDFEAGERGQLVALYPEFSSLIAALTR